MHQTPRPLTALAAQLVVALLLGCAPAIITPPAAPAGGPWPAPMPTPWAGARPEVVHQGIGHYSSLFAQTTPAHFGLRLFRADGRTLPTTGAIGGGGYSFTPDGRFACAGEACRMLRCTVNGRSEVIEHPACRLLRRAAFSIDAELAGRGR